jgi:hypothetical protein
MAHLRWYTSEGDFRKKTMEEAEKAERARLRRIFGVSTSSIQKRTHCISGFPLHLCGCIYVGRGNAHFCWGVSVGEKRAEMRGRHAHFCGGEMHTLTHASIGCPRRIDDVDVDGGGFIDADEVRQLARNLFNEELTGKRSCVRASDRSNRYRWRRVRTHRRPPSARPRATPHSQRRHVAPPPPLRNGPPAAAFSADDGRRVREM